MQVLTHRKGDISFNAEAWLCLCKARISFFAALSAVAGLLLSPHPSWSALPVIFLGVFLLACGACALNNWQERDTDALMDRTAKRPLPAGKIKPGSALLLAIAAICSGAVVLVSTGAAAPLLGIAAILWYNGFYTWCKRYSPFAAIPGALVGAIPPAIGWMAGGGTPDIRLMTLSFFFFMWQVPHFFIHLLTFGKEYEDARLPSLTKVFRQAQLHRLTFQWIMATAVSLQLVIFFGLMNSPLTRNCLLAASLWLVLTGMEFMRVRKPAYTALFRRTNYFMLAVMIFTFLDKMPGLL